MRSIDLIEFIKEARLGHITLSSSKDEIKKVFGQPKHIAKWGEGGKLDPVACRAGAHFVDLLTKE